MEITRRKLNRVDVLAISGRLDAQSAPALQQEFETLFADSRHRILLDLGQLEYISSPGLRVLIDARKRAREWKLSDMDRGDVRIANLPPRIREVFDLTGFTSLFEIYDDMVDGVGSF